MKSLRYSIFIIWSIILIPTHSIASLGMPAVAFKDVGACYKPGFEMYAPMFGSMALSSGFIENLRLYNVIPGFDEEEKRIYVKDRALENDPIMNIMLTLFPSPAGQLMTEGNGFDNVGKHLNENDIAQLFNLIYGVRSWLTAEKLSEKHSPKKKEPLNQIATIFKNAKFHGLSDHLKKMKINSNTLITNLRSKSSESRFKKKINTLFVNIVKAIEQESTIDQKSNQSESKKEEEDEQVETVANVSFYPNHMVEQIIGAFFCHKFSRQDNIKTLLINLHEDIIYKEKITDIDRLLQEDDVFPAREKIRNGEVSLDDIWLGLHRDYFFRILPYKNNQNPISNGNAQMYIRSLEEEKEKINRRTFADCVEVTIRHIMNFILFDSKEKKFSLKELDQFMTERDQTYIKNLKDFYAYQTPDLANSGDLQVRSLWNRVVADLEGNVSYLQNFQAQKYNNEIKSGILNFIRIFEKIFNLNLGDEPRLIAGQEDSFTKQVQKRFSDCFKTLFEELSPREINFNIDFSNVKAFKINENHDLSGNISITINTKDSDKNLFSFAIQILDYHIFIDNLKINENESGILGTVETEQIVKKLNDFSIHEGASSLFLTDELIEYYGIKSNPIYQIFGKSFNDTDGKLRALDTCNDLLDSSNEEQIDLIIANIMNNYLWDDNHSVKIISNRMFKKYQWNNQKFKNIIKKYFKKIKLSYLNSEIPSLLEFSALKSISFQECKNVKSLNKLPKNIEKIKLIDLRIETLDLSELSKLKTVTINDCPNIESLDGLPKNIEEVKLIDLPIKTLDLSEFPKLKAITVDQCSNIRSLHRLPKSIEEIDISSLSIATLNLSEFPKLRKLTIDTCSNIKSLHELPKNIEKIDISSLSIEAFNLSEFPKLKKLTIHDCPNIKSLDGSSKNIEEMNLIYLDIIIPDVSKFPKLKTLYISECLNIKKLRKSSTSIESFSILESTIETLDISGFSGLKALLLTGCDSLNSIIIPESFPDEQRKQLENEYPGIVQFKKEYLDKLQKKLEQVNHFSFPDNEIEKWYDEDNPK